MIETPHVVDTDETIAAVIHLTVPRSDMPKVVPAAIQELVAALTAQGQSPQGPLFMHHVTLSSDSMASATPV